MHNTLQRQLKKVWALGSAQDLQPFLDQLALDSAAMPLPAGIARVMQSLPRLLERVGSTYEQYDRDAELRVRSLELSSNELGSLNEKLSAELAARNRAIAALRALASKATLDDTAAGEEALAAPAADEDSLEKLSMAVTRLVAELKSERAEQTLLQTALDQHAIVSINDREGRLLYVNDKLCKVSGYGREELLGRHFRLIDFGRDTSDNLMDAVKTSNAGFVWQGTVLNLNRQGLPYSVEMTTVPMRGESGGIERFICVRTDVTALQRLTEDLSSTSSKLADQLSFVDTLFQSLPIPVSVKDTQGRYLRFNRAYREMFGVDGSSLGQTAEALGHWTELDGAKNVPNTLSALESIEPVVYENRMLTRSGRELHLLMSKAALRDIDSRVTGVVNTCVDISAQKDAEAVMKTAKDTAETASRMKSEFLANMSHEIRTPMNGVIGMTDLVLETELDEQQRQYLELVRSSAEALMGIVNQILDFSKIEAGKLAVEHIAFDLHRMVSDVLRSFAPRVDTGRVALLMEIDPSLPSRVLGDPGRVRQILANLLGNAIKFTAQGEIAVTLTMLASRKGLLQVALCVRDSGVGISKDKQADIFSPFSQEDASITRRFGGTGLGLTICERLARMMGGSIRVESEPGVGSEFTVTLSLGVESDACLQREPHPALQGRRVLLVHYPGTGRDILLRSLAHLGCRLAQADAPGLAQDLLAVQQPRFDLVLYAPEADGSGGNTTAATLCAAAGPGTPVILLAGTRDLQDRAALHQAGIAAHLLVPAAHSELQALMVQVLVGEVAVRPEVARISHLNQLPDALRSHRILVAEDNEVNQILALTLLKGWGHEVTLAHDGAQAVELHERSRFDLILMDMMMPRLSGLQATERIRALERAEKRPAVPIIAVTANAMESDRQRCLDAGMNKFLSKPLRSADLLRTIKECLLQAAAGSGLHLGPDALGPSVVPKASGHDYAKALEAVEPEVLAIIGEAFVDSCPQEIGKILSAIDRNDTAEVARTAHSLKGLLKGFNAGPAAECAARLEGREKNGPASAHEARQLLLDLQQELDCFLPLLLEISRRTTL